MKHPVAIYADFETINVKIEGCKADPTISKTIHKCSGYSYKVVSPYFPNKVKTYRGEDAGEVFLRNILEEEKKIFKMLNIIEKKNHNLTPEEKNSGKKKRNVTSARKFL